MLTTKQPNHDSSLQRRLLRGDESAFERFFEEHHPAVYRFALGRCNGDRDLAEEIAQLTLIKAIRKVHTWRGEASLLTWVLTLCRHELFDQLSARQRHLEIAADDLGPELVAALESLSDSTADPTRRLDRQELSLQVRAALDRLHPRQRLAVEGKYLEELSVREIARQLEVSEKAAESLLSRGRSAFREAFLILMAEERRFATQRT